MSVIENHRPYKRTASIKQTRDNTNYKLKITDRTRERHQLDICYVIGYLVALMKLIRTQTRDNTNVLTGSSNIQDR